MPITINDLTLNDCTKCWWRTPELLVQGFNGSEVYRIYCERCGQTIESCGPFTDWSNSNPFKDWNAANPKNEARMKIKEIYFVGRGIAIGLSLAFVFAFIVLGVTNYLCR